MTADLLRKAGNGPPHDFVEGFWGYSHLAALKAQATLKVDIKQEKKARIGDIGRLLSFSPP